MTPLLPADFIQPEPANNFAHKSWRDHLVCRNIFCQLVFDIFCNRFFIASDRIHVVSPVPEVPISLFVLQVCVSVEDHQAAFPLEVSHELRYTQIRWDAYEHMDMIQVRLCFYPLYALLFIQFSQYLPYVCLDLIVYFLPAIFRHKYDILLASPLWMC